MQNEKHLIEIANLAEVEKAISSCVEQKRSLGLSLVLGLHKQLLQGIPEEPGHPIMPGRLRPTSVEIKVGGSEHMQNTCNQRMHGG